MLDDHIDWFPVLIAIWLCAVGSVIGSFLNVVVYRLPLGMSVVRPASRCPECLTPIRWYDNLPVVSWLWLGGRCRACGAPIAARYPLVEALVAAFFVLLAASEFCFGGAREPISAARTGFHAPLASDLGATEVWMRYWLQIVLAVSLLAAGLMEWDGQSAPRKLFLASLALSATIPFAWRGARPLPFELGLERWFTSYQPARPQVMDFLLGAWAGLFVALLSWRLSVSDRWERRPMMMAMLAIGVTLGWQLTALVGAIWIAWLIARRVTGAQQRGGVPSLAAIGGLTMLAWRPALTFAVKLLAA